MTQKKFKITGNPDQQEADMSTQRAFDMPAIHIYKIWGGQIHEIEAIGIVAPYNAPLVGSKYVLLHIWCQI
jgi:hypothetical protein